MGPICVAVMDEHEIFRRGIVACLAEDPLLDVVAAGGDPPDLDLHVDVGVASPAALRRWRPTIPLVVCGAPEAITSDLVDRPDVVAVFRRHVLQPEQLASAVRAAAVGLRLEPAGGASPSQLTQRALQVLELLASGATTKEISERLGWSERTIKGAIQEAQHDLGARSRAHAVAVALRQRLI